MTKYAAPPIRDYSREKFEAWRQRHRGDPFSGQWNAILAQRMRDLEVSDADRFLAWLTLYAAGNFSDWPVDSAGNEKFRRDCEQDTGMDRRRVSEAVSANVLLGYVIVPDHKGRFPDGTVGPPGRLVQADGTEEANIKRNSADMSGQDSPSVRFLNFTADWLRRHPEKQQARDEAEKRRVEAVAIVKAIDYEILSDWNKVKEEESEDCEEKAKAQRSDAGSDLSGQVGQTVRTGRTKRPDRSDKTGSILIDVKTTNRKGERAAAAGLSVGSMAPTQPPPPAHPHPAPLVKTVDVQQVRQALQSHDRSVTVKQAQQLVADCCAARAGIETAHIVAVIHHKAEQRRGSKPNSLYAAVFRTQVPEFIGSDEQFYRFLQNPHGNGNDSAPDADLSPRERRRRAAYAQVMESDEIPRF